VSVARAGFLPNCLQLVFFSGFKFCGHGKASLAVGPGENVEVERGRSGGERTARAPHFSPSRSLPRGDRAHRKFPLPPRLVSIALPPALLAVPFVKTTRRLRKGWLVASTGIMAEGSEEAEAACRRNAGAKRRAGRGGPTVTHPETD
jgi:hypothetical protein